jgi:hypothetical protein
MIYLAQAILSQLLVLKCCSKVMPSFARIVASQPNNRHTLFRSAKEVLVTSFKILDIWRCVQDGFLGVSQSNTNPRGKPFLWSCRHVFKVREIASYPGLLQQMKPGSIILNRRLKDNPWNDTIFNLPGGGGISKCLHQQDSHGHCLPGLWKRQLWCLHQDSDRTHEAFQTSSASQDSDRPRMPSQNLVGYCYPIHLTAPPSILRFHLIWSPEECHPWYKVWDSWWCGLRGENLTIWVERGMELTSHTHSYLYSSLVQGCRSGQRLCIKMGYGVIHFLYSIIFMM